MVRSPQKADADAQLNLGEAYENGDGVSRDYAEAMKWYQKAAEQGDISTQVYLGQYEEGNKVPQDYAESMKWYKKPQIRGMSKHSLASGVCTHKATECRRTMPKR